MTGNQPFSLPRAGRTLLPAMTLLLSAGLAGGVHAAEWAPQRTVELVVGAGAGGPLDVTARTIQRIWRERGIVTVNTAVLNKPGAGGALGFKYLNDNGGDGHHLAVTSTTLLTNGITGTSAIRYTDLTPVAILFSEHVAFGVRADSGLKTADDLVRTLRAAPGSITISIASVLGNHNHLGAAALTKKAGGNVRDLKIVVNKSSGESVTVLLGGHVDAVAATASNFVAHVETGKIRILAIAAPSRLGGALSQVPTFREQGHDVVVGAWRGVVGPGKMSAAQLAYWEKAFAQLVRSADWKTELDKRYFQDTFKGHRETAQFLAAEHAELKTLLTEVGLAR